MGATVQEVILKKRELRVNILKFQQKIRLDKLLKINSNLEIMQFLF